MTGTSSYVGDEIDQTSFTLPSVTVCEPEPAALEIQTLCPFCGTFNSGMGRPCLSCNLEDTTATRAANIKKSGPWSVLKVIQADAREVTFGQLQEMVRTRELTSRSVVRGPVTGQLWRLASKVRGLSREFGQCYFCSGDIETDETFCPHCDRVQTLPTLTETSAKPDAAATPTENPKAVRDALLNEPVIHVHSLSHPDHTPVDPVMAARPVVAERSERHIPKDDLLTPRDVAKAFQLEFGLQKEQLDRHLAPSRNTARTMKIAFTSGAALTLAALLVWPVTHVVSGWINAMPVRTHQPVAAESTLADARIINHASFVFADANEFPAIAPRPSYEPAARSITAGAKLEPTVDAEPAPTPSVEDDPKLLWTTALDEESAGNYAAAVQTYERIESLPSNLWPANLEVRLSLARKEAKGDVR